jgi:hypothetical protein
MRWHRALVLGAVALADCKAVQSAGDSGSATSSGTTSSGTAESSSTGSGTGMPSVCMTSTDCGEEGHCVAPYDPGGGGLGEATCVPECTVEDDLLRWCIDDASCCMGLRCRAVDGFCVPPTDGGSSGSSGSSSGGSSSTGTT